MAYKQTVVGLDIGSYAVKAVWAERRGRNIAVSRAESLKLPPEKANLDSIIGSWIDKIGIRRYPCVTGIHGSNTIFQPVFLSPEDPRTFDQAAAMEVVRFNEMASDLMTFSHSPITINPGERRLLLGMVRAAIVEQILEKTRSWNLNVINVVPTPSALFEAAILCDDQSSSPQPVLYANIGLSGTEIAIGNRASGLLFARFFAVGGQMFTDVIAGSEKVSPVQAEQRKIADGNINGTSQMSVALARVAETWVQEMQSCLAVYRNLFQDRRVQPSRIVLSGGGSALRNLNEYLSSKLNMSVTSLSSVPGIRQTAGSPAFATAAGLAIAGIRGDSGEHVLSLLPEETRIELVFRRQKPFWIAAGITAFLILAVSLIAGYLDFKRMEKHLTDQDKKLQRRQSIMAEIDAIRAKNDLITTMSRPLRESMDRALIVCRIISLASQSASPQESFFLLADSDTYFNQSQIQDSKTVAGMRDRRRSVKRPNDQAQSVSTSAFSRIILEGYTRNTSLASVKNLITSLSQADFVESADLLTDDRMAPPSIPMADHLIRQRFAIELKLKSP